MGQVSEVAPTGASVWVGKKMENETHNGQLGFHNRQLELHKGRFIQTSGS